MKKNLLILCLLFLPCSTLVSQHVVVVGNKFQVNGRDIFFNAISGPWQWRADCDINFMRRDFDWNYWNQEFQRYAANNINLVRIWLHGSGNYSPAINSNSFVDAYGPNDQFWRDMDALVALAQTYEVYIMPTFWSFDMVKQGMSTYYQRYRTLIQDDNRMGSYLNNFLIPFLNRYESNPWIMGYDLVNEPEHMWRDADNGHLNQYWVMRFFARCAATVNLHSNKPVTIGSMWVVYNSPNFGSPDGDPQAGWNRYTDQSLRSYFDSPHAYLDFYSPHWYQWQNTSGPYERTVQQWLGTNDKPVIIGETYGGNLPNVYGTLANYYIQAYQNGFDGVIGWKNACQNDGYGTWAGISPATNAFYNAYPHLVYPWRTTNCTAINIPGRIEAEGFCNMSGVQTENTSDAGGGLNVGWIDAGDWMSYRVNVPSTGTYTVSYRVASVSTGRTIRLERGGGSPIYGQISVPNTGGWQTWQTISHNVNLPAGEFDLAIYTETGGFNLNWFDISPLQNQNVAYQKPAFASSVESASHSASFAFDGNGNTRWSSTYNDPQWIYVDLQQNYNINRVRLDWEAACARMFQIQVSTDNQNWTTVYSNYNHAGGVTDVQLSTVGRFVKMYGWERATPWGYSIWEFEVYGNPVSGQRRMVDGEQYDQKEETLTIYPNPASQQVFISGFDKLTEVKIFDMSGLVKAEFKLVAESVTVDVSFWPAGIYIIRAGDVVRKLTVYN
jgi:hypothetical protein